MRKLASIRKIAEIKPIKDADAIEAVRVDGWWLVSKKNEFKVNDLCVYFEVDSFLPVRPEFEFLHKSSFKSTQHLGDGFRLKTVKLRGQLSQGLALPLSVFSEFYYDYNGYFYSTFDSTSSISTDINLPVLETQDVTELFGVKKWEMPIPAQLAGQIKGSFPSFIRKTDQERIQNCYHQYKEQHYYTTFETSLKLDGSSMTVYWNNGEFGVCSRNLELKESDGNTYWKVARDTNLEKILSSYNRNIALQGELMGPGIQGNRESLSQHTMYLYDIWDIDAQKYLGQYDRMKVYLDMLNMGDDNFIKHVPVYKPEQIFQYKLEEILSLADRKSLNHNIAEGLVFKSMDGTFFFKAINNKFLLNEKD